MSADYFVADEETVNVTYNLSKMLREAGFPGHDEMTGAPCSEAGAIFARCAEKIRSEPERFKQFEAENGWGDTRWALEFLDEMTRVCGAHPTAFIGTWL